MTVCSSFLAELRNLAVNERSLTYGTTLRMRKAPIFLGMKRKPRKLDKSSTDWDDEEWEIVHDLKRPSEVVIADDTNAYQAFGDTLFAAPQEDILEGRVQWFVIHLALLISGRVLYLFRGSKAQSPRSGRTSYIFRTCQFQDSVRDQKFDFRTPTTLPPRTHAHPN